MAISSVLMAFNGQVSQKMNISLFMSLYALFNFYLFFIGYLYAPSLDFSPSVKAGIHIGPRAHGTEAEEERERIMNEFYLNELDEEKEDKPQSKSSIGLKKKQESAD